MRSVRFGALVAGISLAVSVVGCSSSSGSSSASANSIKVMVIGQFQATTFSFPEMQDAARAAAKAANDSGGIAGKQIVLEACNDQDDPNVAAQCARSAVTDHVAAVLGSISLQDTAILPLLQAAQIPYIGALPLVSADYTSPVSFPLDGGNPANFAGIGYALTQAGCTKVGVIDDTAGASASSGEMLQAGIRAAGGTITKVEAITSTTPDFAPGVSALLGSGAKCIGVAETPSAMAKVVGAVRQSSAPTTLIAASLATLPLPVIQALKGGADGMLLTVSGYVPGKTTTPVMLEQFKAYKTNLTVDNPSEDAWSAATAFIDVAKTIKGPVDASSVLAALNATNSLKLQTYPAPIDFAKANPAKNYTRLFNTSALVYKVSGGNYTLVATTPVNVEPAVLKVAG
jgi:ABC-type branched-subunit amino acid transport system substrate-binding protein